MMMKTFRGESDFQMDTAKSTIQSATTGVSQEISEGDYYDNEGYLICGKCNTRRQIEISFPPGFCGSEEPQRVIIPCECRRVKIEEEERREEQRRFRQRMEALRRDGITDPKYLEYTFSQDDRRNPDKSDYCRRYVENWPEMKAENTGILFYGDVGTGKSYFACCIANALLEKLVSVSVTNFPRLLNKLQGFSDDGRQAFIDRLQRYSLLVIDDLGVERDTTYGGEQMFNVIDTRARSGKPTIITTNLSLKEMESPTTMMQRRIYDRVMGMCPIRLKFEGDSRRVEIAGEKRDRARKLLKGEQRKGEWQ